MSVLPADTTELDASLRRPRVDVVFPALPPALDGIGDHTARLTEALAAHASVRVLTAQSNPAPIPGVDVETAFSLDTRRGVWDIVEAVRRDPPDWLLLQFNQFSYGRWGLNPFLPLALRRLRRVCPDLRIAWLAHEDFVPLTSWKFAVMTTWQRAQFWALGRLADVVFFTIEPWVDRYASWFPNTPVRHLPVGSNMPHVGADPAEARAWLGLDPDAFVVGVFGTLSAARPLDFFARAAAALQAHTDRATFLYVGPDGDAFQAALAHDPAGDVPVIDAGRRSAEDVSRCFAAMDLHLAPYIDGISTRRGACMAGLQHGVATVGTVGPLTDAILTRADGDAFRLAPVDAPDVFAHHVVDLYTDDVARARIARGGQTLYDASFTWPVLARRLADHLDLPVSSPSLASTS